MRESSCRMVHILRAAGHLDVEHALAGAGIAIAMAHGANAPDALGDVAKLVHIALFGKLLESAVHKADLRNCLDDAIVLDHQVQMKRLGQHRVLRAKRNNGAMCHGPYASFLLVAGGLGGKRRADLGRFLGIHGGKLCFQLGGFERGLGGSFIVLSIGAGSRSGLSDSSTTAPPPPQRPQPRRPSQPRPCVPLPRQRHGPSWPSRARPSPRA